MTDFVSILLLKHAEKAEGVSEVYTFPNFTYTPWIIQSNCLDIYLSSRWAFSSFILVSNTCTKEHTEKPDSGKQNRAFKSLMLCFIQLSSDRFWFCACAVSVQVTLVFNYARLFFSEHNFVQASATSFN